MNGVTVNNSYTSAELVVTLLAGVPLRLVRSNSTVTHARKKRSSTSSYAIDSILRRRASDLNGDTALIIGPSPSGNRGGLMIAQEGQRWIVTLITYFGDPVQSDLRVSLSLHASCPLRSSMM